MDDVDLDQLLASYFRICAEVGIEPLPDDEARESAMAMMGVLVPAFDIEFRQY